MSTLRRFAKNGTAIHDLGHIASLSAVPEIVLFVSERTLYVLQNLVDAEASWRTRYAVDVSSSGYVPVEEGDPEWSDYIDTVNNLGVEVFSEMPVYQDAVFKLWQGENEIDLVWQYARVMVYGQLAVVHVGFRANENGTAGQVIYLEPPSSPPLYSQTNRTIGHFRYSRVGGNYVGIVFSTLTNEFRLVVNEGNHFGANPSVAVAVNDVLTCNLAYEWVSA